MNTQKIFYVLLSAMNQDDPSLLFPRDLPKQMLLACEREV